MFDKILSGNKDISCGTCHHPSYHTTDNATLSIGTGGVRSGPARVEKTGRFTRRNSPDLFNRDQLDWREFFWDGRVSVSNGVLTTPAGNAVSPSVKSLLTAQAMFPVLGRDEMRGNPGDTTVLGEVNELGVLADPDYAGIWSALTARLLAIPAYRARFQTAFPEVDVLNLGFEHVARALAAFEGATFSLQNSPFDRYLAGDVSALTEDAKRGALLFYGRARCSRCHAGSLLTDQAFHNIGIPAIGRYPSDSIDMGRFEVTGRVVDRFAFRTPPLRNVSLSGPWMHDGAYTSLAAVIRHYRNPAAALDHYDPTQLDPRFRALVQNAPSILEMLKGSIDPILQQPIPISESEVTELLAFLRALTDPAAINMVSEIPSHVPSGLPVFR